MSSNFPVVPQDGNLGKFISNVRFMIQQEMEVKQIPSIAVSISRECKRVYSEGMKCFQRLYETEFQLK